MVAVIQFPPQVLSPILFLLKVHSTVAVVTGKIDSMDANLDKLEKAAATSSSQICRL